MNKYEIIKRIEKFAPVETAEPWDCVGFMAETRNKNISKIMLCLTPTENIIKQALSQNCDMIISHHPMFEISLESELVTDKYEPKIDIYSAHTNMDKANGGTTDTVIKTLGLDEFKQQIDHEFLRLVEFTQAISVTDFAQKLKKLSPNLRYVNNNDIKTISKIMFCAGSGSDFINEAKSMGADCLVTGDLKFHTALESDIVVFDIGHFDSEIIILPVFKNIIGSDVEIIFANEKSPFIV